MVDKQALINELHSAGVVETGEFTLKSGAVSPVYIDLRRLVAFPRLLASVAAAYAEAAARLQFDVLAALPYAAMPIGTALSLHMDRPMVYPRKERKGYGTDKLVEGIFERGATALVVDDVVTDGGAKLEGIHDLEEAGLVVKDVLVMVDRQAGGKEALKAAGYELHSLLTLAEIVSATGVSQTG